MYATGNCPACGTRVRVPDPLPPRMTCPHCQRVISMLANYQPDTDPLPATADYPEVPPVRAPEPAPSNVVQTWVNVESPRREFPHVLHLVLTVATCGLWLPVWVLHYLFSR